MNSIIAPLVNSPDVYSIEYAYKLAKVANKLGITNSQIKQLASDELKNHGNQSGTAFKARVVGTAGLVIFSIMALVFLFNGQTPHAIVLFVIAALSGLFARYGYNETPRAAFAALILREKVNGMSAEQISVFKDNPAIRGCSDTMHMLTKIQEKKAQKSQSATPLAQ